MNPRITWMDTLRGLAMLLLLFWHAAAIPAFYGWQMPQWLLLFNEIFLPWRMPTLMFLSGLLLERSLAKPVRVFYVGKARAILWPYVLWAGLHISTFPELQPERLLSPMAWVATGYLWFIFYLMVYYCFAPLVTRLPWWLVLPVGGIAALVLDNSLLQPMAYFGVFFFAGYYVRKYLPRILEASRTVFGLQLLVAAGFTAVSLWLTAATDSHFFKYNALVIPFAFVLILVSVRVAAWLDKEFGRRPDVRLVGFVGRHSIIFYLSHFPLIGLLSWLAGVVGIPLGLWVVPVNWVAAVAIGLLLAKASERTPMSWLFSFGRPRAAARERAAVE